MMLNVRPPKTPLHGRMMEILADGEWHDRDQLVYEMGKTIPPGVAKRKAELVRDQHAAVHAKALGKPTPPRKVMRSDDWLIASGRRNLAGTCIKNALHKLEERTVDRRRQVRLKPQQ